MAVERNTGYAAGHLLQRLSPASNPDLFSRIYHLRTKKGGDPGIWTDNTSKNRYAYRLQEALSAGTNLGFLERFIVAPPVRIGATYSSGEKSEQRIRAQQNGYDQLRRSQWNYEEDTSKKTRSIVGWSAKGGGKQDDIVLALSMAVDVLRNWEIKTPYPLVPWNLIKTQMGNGRSIH